MKQDELIVSDSQAMQALKQHGGNIIMAIVLVLAVFFAWQFYQKKYAKIDTQAADMYASIGTQNEQLIAMQANANANSNADIDARQKSLTQDIDKLVATHGDTVYAWQALMIKARHQADANDYANALLTLKQALAVPIEDKGLLAISSLQMARIQLENQDIKGALDTLATELPEAFEATRQEILGDVYVANNQTDVAQEAYQKAWDILNARHENRSLLRLKMQALGQNVPVIDEEYAVVNLPHAQAQSTQVATALANP